MFVSAFKVMSINTLPVSQTNFVRLTEHYQEKNLTFDISANEFFHLPDLAANEKSGRLKFENGAILNGIIF